LKTPDEMVKELRQAIHRYKHLLKGGEIDYDWTLKVEEAEARLMEEIRGDNNIIEALRSEPLDRALSRIAGRLEGLIEKAAEMLGESVPDPGAALEAFLVGDTHRPGFRSAFVAVQALARVKAELYEDENGNVESRGPVCPVCGAVSRTMLRDDRGDYYMVCPFCGYKWLVSRKRLVCPYCGNSDALSLGVFTGKRSKRLGLAWCQECGATRRVVLDTTIRVPRLLLPVIAHGAEIYRSLLPAMGGAALADPFRDAR